MMCHEVNIGDIVIIDGQRFTLVAKEAPPSKRYYVSDKLGDEATLDTAVDIRHVSEMSR